MKALKMLLWIPVGLIGVYLAVTLYIYFNQDKMVFYPIENFSMLPHQVGLSYEDVEIKMDENTIIHGWFFPSGDSTNSKAVLLCHGNAGNISNRLETAQYLHDLGVAVFMFDYRGYGKSTGEPTEEGVYLDGIACLNWLNEAKQFVDEDIIIFGRSLGGAVAVELAGRVNSGGLVVESSFTTIGDLGQKLFPLFPIKTLIRYSFNSEEKIADLKVQKLITHSPEDELIPYVMGEKLFAVASEPKQFVRLSGGHNSRTYFNDPEYKNALLNLIYGGSQQTAEE